jgi:uncharacterized protein YcbK (DUF882 family)
MRVSEHFDDSEFRCPCCSTVKVDSELINRLEIARRLANIPFAINSGYRCQAFNDSLENSVPTSSHVTGKAVDIVANAGATRYNIVKSLILAGFKRIGIGASFIHADVDADKPQLTMWTYYE